MNILVTGGMGFIGSHFINKLREIYPNCDITVIDKLTYASNPNNLKTQVKFINNDICNVTELNTLSRASVAFTHTLLVKQSSAREQT